MVLLRERCAVIFQIGLSSESTYSQSFLLIVSNACTVLEAIQPRSQGLSFLPSEKKDPGNEVGGYVGCPDPNPVVRNAW